MADPTPPTSGTPQPPQGGGTPPTPPPAHPAGEQPTGAQPAGAQPPATRPPQPAPPANPNARTGQLGKKDGNIFVIPPHPNTTFDDAQFLALLEGSISLTIEEKQRVIDAIPRLKIEQINELIKIFEEEKHKFSELENEFAQDVAKLKAEREKEISLHENKQEEAVDASSDAEEAEALKKQLGL